MPRERKEVYFRNLESSTAPGFFLRSVGKTHVFADYRIGPARKTNYTLLVICSGRGSMQTPHGHVHFSQGHVIAQLRDQTYVWWTDPSALLEHYWLTMEGDVAGVILRALGIDERTCVIRRPAVPAGELAACEALLQLFKQKPSGYEWKANALFYDICHSIAVTSRQTSGQPLAADDAVERARRMMDAGFRDALRISEVARRVALTPDYLTTQFRRRYGVPPHTYLTKRRLEHAKVLLRGGAPVHEAAAAVGYRDPNYFSRVFHKNEGIPPSRILAGAGDAQPKEP